MPEFWSCPSPFLKSVSPRSLPRSENTLPAPPLLTWRWCSNRSRGCAIFSDETDAVGALTQGQWAGGACAVACRLTDASQYHVVPAG